MEAVQLLTNFLNYHDAKVLEHVSICLTLIAESFASSSEKLDQFCKHGLVAQAASLIALSSSAAGQASLSGSPFAAKILHGISGTLKVILAGSGLVAGTTVYPTRPADQFAKN